MPEVRRTVCNRDCPDTCGILATVDGGRVTRLAGDPDHPVTRGTLCYRTSRFLARHYSKDRLTSPLMRKDGELRPVSWDEALDFLAARLTAIRAESGPAAIHHYRSGGSLGLLKHATDHFFSHFGPVTVKGGDICSGAGDWAQVEDFGEEESHDLFDLLNSRNVILWGKNAVVASPHTLRVLKDAQARGAELVLIDPVFNKTVHHCDRYVQIRPGGDFALAMAVSRLLFERGWLDPDLDRYCDNVAEFGALCRQKSVGAWCADADVDVSAAEDLAARLGPGKPTAILVGWGLGRRIHGAATVRALDALSLISGNIGRPGGGVSFYFKRRGAFETGIFRGKEGAPREICEIVFGQQILEARDPPIRAVWVTAGNPVVMLPESETTVRALKSRELVVVVDSFMTDTAALAHVVLPTTTLLEDDDLIGAYGNHWIGASRPVVAPPTGVKTDLQIVQALAERVNLGPVLAGDARAWKERLVRPKLAAHDIDVDRLERESLRNPLASEILFADRRFKTPTRRARLLAEGPMALPRRDGAFPLILFAISTEKAQCSQWAVESDGPAELVVHPESAQGIGDGGLGSLESKIGAMKVLVRHDPRQRRDVALMAKGGSLAAGRCANALISARLTDQGEGAVLYDEGVRLRPA